MTEKYRIGLKEKKNHFGRGYFPTTPQKKVSIRTGKKIFISLEILFLKLNHKMRNFVGMDVMIL